MWKNIEIKKRQKRSDFVSEPNYHLTKWFADKLLATEMIKNKLKWVNLLILV